MYIMSQRDSSLRLRRKISMLIVQKFGGSSLADLERLRRAAGICARARRKEHDTVVVVSAMGDSTDDLLDIAHRISPCPPLRELDALLCCGEQQSAALMAIMLESMGVSARSFSGWQAGIHTDSRHFSAEILSIKPERIRSALSQAQVAVVSGFQGVDGDGDMNTLGRGGSDTSAVSLALALGADRCEIYTDVDGIYTADPRLISKAMLLEKIDYRDMLRLACRGSQVLHRRCVSLAMEKKLDLRLMSSFRDLPGTALAFLEDEERPDIAGITRDETEGSLSIVGKAADAALGARLSELLSSGGFEAESMQLYEGCVSFGLRQQDLVPAMRLVHGFLFAEN